MTNQNDQSKTISKGRFLIQEIVVKTDENLIDHERLRRTKHLSLCKRIYHKSFNFENRKNILFCILYDHSKKEWFNFNYVEAYINTIIAKNKYLDEEITKKTNSCINDIIFNHVDYLEDNANEPDGKSKTSSSKKFMFSNNFSNNSNSIDNGSFLRFDSKRILSKKSSTKFNETSDLGDQNEENLDNMEKVNKLIKPSLKNQPKLLDIDLNLNLYNTKLPNEKEKNNKEDKDRFRHNHHNKNINSVEINFRNNLIRSPACSPINKNSKINFENIICSERKVSYFSYKDCIDNQIGLKGLKKLNTYKTEEFGYENLVSKYEKILNVSKKNSKYTRNSDNHELSDLLKILKKRKKKLSNKKNAFNNLLVQNVFNYNYLADVSSKVSSPIAFNNLNSFTIVSNISSGSVINGLNSTQDTIEKLCCKCENKTIASS